MRPQARLAIASYLTNGQPGDTRGSFGMLRWFTEDVTGWLSARLEERVGERIEVRFEHDGTAAAMVYAGEEGLCRLGEGFVVG